MMGRVCGSTGIGKNCQAEVSEASMPFIVNQNVRLGAKDNLNGECEKYKKCLPHEGHREQCSASEGMLALVQFRTAIF